MNILSWLKNLFSRKKENAVSGLTQSTSSPSGVPVGGISDSPTTNTVTYDVFTELNKLKIELTELKTKTSSALDEVEKQKKEVKEALDTARDTRALVVFGLFIMLLMLGGLFLDYFYKNDQRYENFINKTEKIGSNFYTKDDLKGVIEENKINTKILECLKNKEYFSIKCFK